MANKGPIYYVSIPSTTGQGSTILSIYPPGSWFECPDYVCFLGGSGIGHGSMYTRAATLVEAKKLLLKAAKNYCIQRIEEAERQAAHYKAELQKLSEKGLGRRLSPGERP